MWIRHRDGLDQVLHLPERDLLAQRWQLQLELRPIVWRSRRHLWPHPGVQLGQRSLVHRAHDLRLHRRHQKVLHELRRLLRAGQLGWLLARMIWAVSCHSADRSVEPSQAPERARPRRVAVVFFESLLVKCPAGFRRVNRRAADLCWAGA